MVAKNLTKSLCGDKFKYFTKLVSLIPSTKKAKFSDPHMKVEKNMSQVSKSPVEINFISVKDAMRNKNE